METRFNTEYEIFVAQPRRVNRSQIYFSRALNANKAGFKLSLAMISVGNQSSKLSL